MSKVRIAFDADNHLGETPAWSAGEQALKIRAYCEMVQDKDAAVNDQQPLHTGKHAGGAKVSRAGILESVGHAA